MASEKFQRVLIVVLAVVLGPLIAWQVQGRMQNGETIEPFFMETESRNIQAGKDPFVITQLIGVRDDGSRVLRRSYVASDGKTYFVGRISLTGERKALGLNSAVNSTTSAFLSKDDLALLRRTDRNCGLGASAEKMEIVGYAALKQTKERKTDDADNERTWEVWVAPELGCSILKATVWRNGHVDYTSDVKWIRKEAPPAEYFDVPSGYREMMPSQVNSALLRKFGGRPLDEKVMAPMDERYLTRQGLRKE